MSATDTLRRAARLTPSTRLAWLPLPFALERGGVLAEGRLAYEVCGPDDGPVVVVLGGISAGRHVAAHAADPRPGFFDALVGPGRAIDTTRVRVLGVDFLGGVGGSSGPLDLQAGEAFPDVTTADQADALACVLDQLSVPCAHAVVGASYGGMVALAFASRHATRARRLVVIGAADRPDPLATAWRCVQRGIVALGAGQGQAREGLALARALAMASYRGRDELATRFADDPTRLEAYLHARGVAFAQTFDPEAFVVLSRSIDLHRVDPASVTVPTTLVAFRSDQLVPLTRVRALANVLGGPCDLVELDSPFGHDAFLKEPAALAPILRGATAGGAR
ncbi:MAG: homoserine O-succinyltransferase [Phycisphaerales bacterium]|nr:homoserine O-succinyltransferase [Phycisphaerales bacterium]